ncbi:MAG: 1,2-phenylacetyl-CoA epoxidase subunit PaaC [Bacteroidota bacterium]|jgi:ring-1,2-phenylacetyl-CoA epoxidase subunit PaaC
MDRNTALFEYCLRMGDTSLILGQRLSEWCGHGPILEEDIAMSNIALDYIGQSRIIYSYAGQVEGKGRSEDELAYLRDARQYRNLLLTEQPNGDFACTLARQYLMSVYLFHLYSELTSSTDEAIRAFAQKSIKEVAYHLRHSADWMLRLGDGTEESHQRLQDAVNKLWYFVDDLFDADEVDADLLSGGIAADMKKVRASWEQDVKTLFSEATIQIPSVNSFTRVGSRKGNHTEHLGYILAEMQFLPRAYPGAKW